MSIGFIVLREGGEDIFYSIKLSVDLKSRLIILCAI